jgi:hypothetical protein
MMKSLLFSFLFSCAVFLATAQSFSVSNSSETKYGDYNQFEVISYVTVYNNTSTPKNMKVKRIIVSEATGHMNAICWEQCYIPEVDVSPSSIVIPANGSLNNFSGHLYPNGAGGTTQIKYVFFDENNPNDSATFQVTYQVWGLSVNSNELKVSEPYPNPASGVVNFSFTNNRGSSYLVIYDMLGNMVRKAALNGVSGNVKIDVSKLNSGMYFYQIVENGVSGSAKRLLITN